MGQITPQVLEEHAATLELINSELSASLARQASVSHRLDAKATLLVGYAGAVSSFLAAQHHRQPVLAGLAFAAFAAAAGSGIAASAVRRHQDVPAPRTLLTKYVTRSRAQALAALAATRVEVFESNARGNTSKTRWWRISLGCIAIGMTLMIFALTTTYW
ncbi:MAG: hypothetical protein ACLQFR_01555 [Streptosporangiaceae bacterium]